MTVPTINDMIPVRDFNTLRVGERIWLFGGHWRAAYPAGMWAVVAEPAHPGYNPRVQSDDGQAWYAIPDSYPCYRAATGEASRVVHVEPLGTRTEHQAKEAGESAVRRKAREWPYGHALDYALVGSTLEFRFVKEVK